MVLKVEYNTCLNAWDVALNGYIDLYNAPELRTALDEVGEGDIILSCKELSYIDSAGLGVLKAMLASRKAMGSSVCLCDVKSYIYRVFQLAELEKDFKITLAEEDVQ